MSKVVKAYACELCGRPYPHHESGKALADSCCRCRNCGAPGSYLGGSSLCKTCAHEAQWKLVCDNVKLAAINYADLAKRLNRSDADVVKIAREKIR